jgi:SagB-type dehydrogenase family enzyme
VNYATRKYVAAAPLTCEVLNCFGDWRTVAELSDLLPQYDERSLAGAVRQLAQTTLLQRSDRPEHPIEAGIKAWRHWNPAAGFFHFSTKDLKFEADRAKLLRYYRQLAKHTPMDSAIKRYPLATRLPMPAAARDADFSRVLLSRRTWREFADEPIEYSDLATILWLTFGIQGWIDFYGLGKLAMKTSPSGGARHPIEAYVVSRRVKGLKSGVYHYASDRHELERLRALPRPKLLRSLTPAQDWCSKSAVMVFMTAVFGRDQWKYRFPRAYRAVLLDAGHICQTFCLTSSWLGLAPYCTMALADSKIDQLLGLDGVSEGAIYLAGIGARPEGPFGRPALAVTAPPLRDRASLPRRRTKAAKWGSERNGS